MAVPMTSARSQATMAISAEHPEGQRDGLAVLVAAGLGQVAAGGDAQLEGQALQQDGHQVGQHDDEEQGVAEREPPARSVAQLPGSM